MRLTHEMRHKIERTATEKAFAKRRREITAEGYALADRILPHLIPQDQIDLMAKLPRKFFLKGGYYYVTSGSGKDHYYKVTPGLEARTPAFIFGGTHIVEDETLLDAFKSHQDKSDALQKETQTFRAKTEGLLASFSNVERLLAEWPALEEIMPEGFFDVVEKPKLPATLVNELDKTLQAGKPWTEETAETAESAEV